MNAHPLHKVQNELGDLALFVLEGEGTDGIMEGLCHKGQSVNQHEVLGRLFSRPDDEKNRLSFQQRRKKRKKKGQTC